MSFYWMGQNSPRQPRDHVPPDAPSEPVEITYAPVFVSESPAPAPVPPAYSGPADMPDDPGRTPVHYPDHRNPAQNPPGERAPIPVSRDGPLCSYDDLHSLIAEARHLFAVARHPRSDPAFKTMKPDLEYWRARLSSELHTITNILYPARED
jgi:hypothetical protein